MPPDYGNWKIVAKRFHRWVDCGLWEKILENIVDEPDFEWLMIDASHCKMFPYAAGAVNLATDDCSPLALPGLICVDSIWNHLL